MKALSHVVSLRITTPADWSHEDVKKLLAAVIDSGLDDARRTADNPDIYNPDANKVGLMSVAEPVVNGSSDAVAPEWMADEVKTLRRNLADKLFTKSLQSLPEPPEDFGAENGGEEDNGGWDYRGDDELRMPVTFGDGTHGFYYVRFVKGGTTVSEKGYGKNPA